MTFSASKEARDVVSPSWLEKNLAYIQYHVLKIFSETLCTAKFYGAKEIDFECYEIGILAAKQAGFDRKLVMSANARSNHVVLVASRLQRSGGHTRVIEDLVSIMPHANKTILVTGVPGKSDRKLQDAFKERGVEVHWAPSGSLLKKLHWLQTVLLEISPGTVYLFNHHEDSVAVAATSVLGDIDKYFYHHADHHFCLGLYLDGFKHIDFHAFGFHRCRNESLLNENIYLPLTALDLGVDKNAEYSENRKLLTCTAAGHNKLEVPHFVTYFDLIPALLAKTGGKHIHIGKLSWLGKIRMRWKLRKAGVDSSNFIYIPWIESVWKALQDYRVDLFIASFPIVGGKTLVEVMGAGIPLVVHDNPVSRFLGGVDMAYPTAFCWREPEELINFCQIITHQELQRHSRDARTHYEQYHHPDLLKWALQEGAVLSAPPLHPYVSKPSDFLAALQVCKESSPARWLRKYFYCTFRIWRSRIHCYL